MKKQQKGGVLIIVALCLTVLLGFLGLVIDTGQLYVSKTEMQTAMDACSLAAAQELDGQLDSITRAQSAGILAGNLNKVNLQSASPGITAGDFSFSTTLNGATTTDPLSAKYVKCTKSSPAVQTVFMQLLGAADTHSTGATAVATRKVTTTKTCALPMMIAPKNGTSGTKANNYGYTTGDWIADDTAYQPGHFEWGSDAKSASEVEAQLTGSGFCDAEVGDILVTNGTKNSLEKAWNTRFGLYRSGGPTITESAPDFTGYSYTPYNANANPVSTETCTGKGNDKVCTTTTTYTPTGWSGDSNAYSDFLAKRASYESYGGTVDTLSSGNSITGLTMSNPYSNPLSHGTGGEHASKGANRRVVAVPLVNPGREILDFACVLMLHPLDGVATTIHLEFIGLLDDTGSPCGSSSIAGGTSVVNLVQ